LTTGLTLSIQAWLKPPLIREISSQKLIGSQSLMLVSLLSPQWPTLILVRWQVRSQTKEIVIAFSDSKLKFDVFFQSLVRLNILLVIFFLSGTWLKPVSESPSRFFRPFNPSFGSPTEVWSLSLKGHVKICTYILTESLLKRKNAFLHGTKEILVKCFIYISNA